MKSTEFCYWLQGVLELAKPETLNEKQTDIIKRNLTKVFKDDRTPSLFCTQLNGFFIYENPSELNKTQTAKMQEQLREAFINVIDPTYPESAQLNAIHNGDYLSHLGPRIPGQPIAKC